jgi:hypothetical protein
LIPFRLRPYPADRVPSDRGETTVSIERHGGGTTGPSRATFALGVLTTLLVCAAMAREASGFDFTRYRPTSIRAVIRNLPAQQGTVVTTDLPIQARVTYSGEFRPLPDDSRRLIAAWAEAMNVPGMTAAFRRRPSPVPRQRLRGLDGADRAPAGLLPRGVTRRP